MIPEPESRNRPTIKRLQNDGPGDVIHRAGWVVIDPGTIFPNGYVRVSNGWIRQVGQGLPTGGAPVLDHGCGVIFPALVNAHTHLELCGLKGCIETRKGFAFWVKDLIEKREHLDPRALLEASEAGVQELLASGCGAIGEISSLGLSLGVLQKTALAGVWFREYLGGRLPDMEERENLSSCLQTSLAGHAPHTTSPCVLKEIKQQSRRQNKPFSIHLAESDEEMAFLTTGRGPWKDFLLSRGIDSESWGLPAASPVSHLQSMGILDHRTVLVHMLHADQKDLKTIHESGAHVCLCPRSNFALHARLPDLGSMILAGIPLCLGTDSLASVSSLSIFDEMAFAAGSFPAVSPEWIFKMATLGGATALGLDSGTLVPGKEARLAYIDIQASKASQVLERIVHFSRPDEVSGTLSFRPGMGA